MLDHQTANVDITHELSLTAIASAAFQGVEGAFGEEAVRLAWKGRVRAHPAPTFDAALDTVLRGEVDWAVIPIHNSTIGPIVPACRALAARESLLLRVGEVTVPVRHCLLALPGTSFETVRYVGSHPAALAQCTRLFAEDGALTACEAFDTAGAARELAEFPCSSSPEGHAWYSRLVAVDAGALAVIASERAAERYGLTVLWSDVQDAGDNATRFVVVRARAEHR
jgi:prephenate dehydratase